MNHSRRSFIRNSTFVGLGLLIPFKNELMALAPATNSFGIQLWTVKEALAKDPLAVLKHLSQCGYKKIESFEGEKGIFWGMKNTEFKKHMDELGMNLVSAHCDNTTNFDRKAAEAAEQLGLTAQRLKALGLIDKIVAEPIGGAHRDYDTMMTNMRKALAESLKTFDGMKEDALLERRHERLMSYGKFKEITAKS